MSVHGAQVNSIGLDFLILWTGLTKLRLEDEDLRFLTACGANRGDGYKRQILKRDGGAGVTRSRPVLLLVKENRPLRMKESRVSWSVLRPMQQTMH